MFLVEQYPFKVISVAIFPSQFFPLQVTIGVESTMDMRESQSSGLNDCIMVFTSTLNASESIFRRVLNTWIKVAWGTTMTDTPWRKYVFPYCQSISGSNRRTDKR